MNVFVAGATGALGRRLLPVLVHRGHEVIGLARSEEKAAVVRSLGGTPGRVDLFDPEALTGAVARADVVIHAATSIPVGSVARSRQAWAVNDRIRREGTRALTAAAGAAGVGRFLLQSVVLVVGGGGASRDEWSDLDPPELARSAADAETMARDAGAKHGFTVGVLRGGMFYGPDTADSRGMAELLRKRRLPIPGRGTFVVNPVRVTDMARALALAAESERSGTWHIVDDEPVAFRRFLIRFADALDAPRPRRVPLWLARLALGRHMIEAMTGSGRTSNRKARSELGWAPRYPTYREGIALMVREWEEPAHPPTPAA